MSFACLRFAYAFLEVLLERGDGVQLHPLGFVRVEVFRERGAAVAEAAGEALGRGAVLRADGRVGVPQGMGVDAAFFQRDADGVLQDGHAVFAGAYQRAALEAGRRGFLFLDLPQGAVFPFVDKEVGFAARELVFRLFRFPAAQGSQKLAPDGEGADAGRRLGRAEGVPVLRGVGEIPPPGGAAATPLKEGGKSHRLRAVADILLARTAQMAAGNLALRDRERGRGCRRFFRERRRRAGRNQRI